MSKGLRHILLVIAVLLTAQSCLFAADVLDVGTSARSLGMGKSFVLLSGEASAIFGNPAGLNGMNRGEFTSMYGELTGDVKFTMLGFAVPTRSGVYGVGYAGNKTWDLTTTTVDANGRIVPVTNFDYHNDLYIFSYGNKISAPLSYGARLKYYSRGASGIAGVEGHGANMDLGLLYKREGPLSAGIVASNIFSGSLGSIKWSNGTEEKMRTAVNAGIGYSRKDLSLYTEVSSTQDIPMEVKAGGEWSAFQALKIRLGAELVPLDIRARYINYSMGVGYGAGDFKIDYAYYYDGLLPYNSRHFIGLSFILPGEGDVLRIVRGGRLVTTAETAVVEGRTTFFSGIDKIKFGDVTMKVSGNKFTIKTKTLNKGRNMIDITGVDPQGEVISKVTARILRLSYFSDVGPTYWASKEIVCLATLGVMSGSPKEGEYIFRPDAGITRSEMVSALCRLKGIEPLPLTQRPFKDIPVDNWAAWYIKYAVNQGWILGYSDNTFRPLKNISRAEGVAAISRCFRIKGNKFIFSSYLDIRRDYWAVRDIQNARDAGLLDYIKGNNFEPDKPLTRAQFCYMLARVRDVAAEIDGLLRLDAW